LGASQGAAGSGGWSWGFAPALASAFVWASYSLLTQRVKAFPTTAIGLFRLVSGLLSLLCHWALEAPVALSSGDMLLLALMGLGPLGAAFFLWDKALKLGDARQIGILSYLTPLGSTALLMAVSGRPLTWSIALAAALIIGAAVLGTRTR
jgi:drug/metabolite transporter (DMT)-like permease